MYRKYALGKLYEFGDAIINLKSGRAFLATTDFSTKYIRKIRRKRVKDLRGRIMLFNWSENKFEDILSSDISFITPLSKVLNNPEREDESRKV